MKTNLLKIAVVLIPIALAIFLPSCIALQIMPATEEENKNCELKDRVNTKYLSFQPFHIILKNKVEKKAKIKIENEARKKYPSEKVEVKNITIDGKFNAWTLLIAFTGYGLPAGNFQTVKVEGDVYSCTPQNNNITIITGKKNRVAVFDPVDDAKTDMIEMIREILSTGITNSGSFKPVERAMIEQVLQENEYQAEGQVDASQVSELGKQMGADYVCVSVIKKTGTNYFITAKLVSVETATVELQQYVKTENGKEDLFEKVEELSEKLFNK